MVSLHHSLLQVVLCLLDQLKLMTSLRFEQQYQMDYSYILLLDMGFLQFYHQSTFSCHQLDKLQYLGSMVGSCIVHLNARMEHKVKFYMHLRHILVLLKQGRMNQFLHQKLHQRVQDHVLIEQQYHMGCNCILVLDMEQPWLYRQ